MGGATLTGGCDVDVRAEPIARFYAALNAHELDAATALFSSGATIEHMPGRGREAVASFANYWFAAFPDARFTGARIHYQGPTMCEADLIVTGTHRGLLQVGSCRFKPTGGATQVCCRQLFEFADHKIHFSALTFDVQSLIRQLATIDYQAVPAYASRVAALSGRLELASDEDARRLIGEELALTLDAFRKTLRPYFSR